MPYVIGVLVLVGVAIGVFLWIWTRGARHEAAVVETGLKVIDLCVPIPLGSDVLLTGEPKAGVRILGSELAYRLANSPRHPFRVIIFLDAELDDLENVCRELQEVLPTIKQILVTPALTADEIREQRRQNSIHGRDAVFAIGKSAPFVHAFQQAVKAERQSSASTSSLTTFSVAESMSGSEFDTKLISTSLLATEAIYPALDLRLSKSSASSLPRVMARRKEVAEPVRRAITEVLENLRPGALNDADWSFNRDPTKRSAVQALRFMSQPYFTAEPYTGLKSAHVPIDVTIKSFKTILANHLHHVPSKSFQFQNTLPSDQGKAQ